VTAAVAWSTGAGATEFGVSALRAQQGNVDVVPGQSFTLTTGVDAIVGTAGNDTITGTVAASGETFSATDVVIDSSSTDNDTFTITSTVADTTGEIGTISGIENLKVEFNTLAAATLDAGSITDSSITVSQVKPGAVGTVSVTELVGATNVTFGSGVTTASAAYTISSAKAGSAGASVNGGSATTVTVTGLDNNGGVVTAAATATVNLVGAGHSTKNVADDAATVVAGSTVTIDANGDAGNQVENLTVKGNGAATTATISGDGVEKYYVAGEYSVTLSGDEAVFDGETVTDQLTAGVSTVKITTADDSDLSKVAVDVINIAADAVKADAALTVASGANFVISASQNADNAADELTFVGKASTAETNSVTVTFDHSTATTTAVTTPELIFSDIATINLVTVDKLYGANDTTATVVTVDDEAVINISGSATAMIEAHADSGIATLVDASNLTKGLTITTSEAFATVIGGTAADTMKVSDDTVDYDLSAGAGNDTLYFTASGDFTGQTFDGFEVVKLAEDAEVDVDGSLLSGTSMSVVTAAGAGTVNVIADDTTIDLSRLALGDDVTVVLDTSNFTDEDLTITGLASAEQELNGADGDDLITGGSGVDTINGGKGNDTINGGKGANVLDGGAGNDVIVGGSGVDEITGGSGADTLTGGAGVDTFYQTLGVTGVDAETYSVDLTVGGTAAADGNVIIAIDGINYVVAITEDDTAADIATAIATELDGAVDGLVATAEDDVVTIEFSAADYDGDRAVTALSTDDDATVELADETNDGTEAVTATSKVASYDTITDYDGDTITFDAEVTVSADVDGTADKADIADGIATFETSGATSLTEKIAAIEEALADADAYTLVAFEHGTDSFVYVSDADADAHNELLIKITGLAVDEVTVDVTDLTLGF